MTIEKFPGQKENEVIELVIRKHWFADFKKIMEVIILWLIPVIGYIIIVVLRSPGFYSVLENKIVTWAFLLYLLYINLWILIRWLNEVLDIAIITNHRVLCLEQISFMEMTMSETTFDKIEDAKSRIKGFLSNVLEFGSIEVQTASNKVLFQLTDVPSPMQLCQKIIEIMQKYKSKNNPSSQNNNQSFP